MNYLPVLDYSAGAGKTENAPGDKGGTPPTPPQSGPAQNRKNSGKPPIGGPKAPARKKDTTKQPSAPKPADARRKTVYQVMERFLAQGALSDADLLHSVTSMSGDEFRQVAEERALAGLCGNPRCAHSAPAQKPHAHYQLQGQVVYDLADESAVTCSKKCQAVIDMIAGKLGNEDAALYRFTHPTPPAQSVTPAQPPALSNTVKERDPSADPSAKPAAPQSTPLTGSPKGVWPSSRGQAGDGVGAPSHPPRKGSRGLPKYAAGNAKTPIMLADVKEKDPAADEAFIAAEALKQQSTQSTGSNHASAQAVEGFVPKGRSTKANRPDLNCSTHSAQQSTAEASMSSSASATDTAQAPVTASQDATAMQDNTSGASSGQAQKPVTGIIGAAALDCTPDTASEQVGVSAQQRYADSDSQGGSHRPMQQLSGGSNPVLPVKSSDGRTAVNGSSQHAPVTNGTRQEAASDARPILEFEIEDAEGPLEGAAHDLSSQFGRLKVVASEAEASSQTDSRDQQPNAHLMQHYRHPPPADHPEISESDLDEQISIASSDGMTQDDASSDAEGDANTWLADPPKDFRTEMTPFGAIYTLLDTWPTETTRVYLTSSDDAPRQHQASSSAAFGTSKEMLKTMSTIFSRVVPFVVKELQIAVSRSTVEQHLFELLTTMYFSTPIPAIKDSHWQILVLVLIKALSLHRLDALQDSLLSRKGLLVLSRLLQAQEFTNEMFDALLEVLVEGS